MIHICLSILSDFSFGGKSHLDKYELKYYCGFISISLIMELHIFHIPVGISMSYLGNNCSCVYPIFDCDIRFLLPSCRNS